MSVSNYTILPAEGARTNFNDWNSIRNRYNTATYKTDRRPPKKLVAAVIREFEEFCKDYHIDASKYKFITPCEIEGKREWRQFDFLDSVTDRYPARIMVSDIIINENKTILQRIISI